jgi:Fuc2NAc and GlcNAc transferase
VRSSHSVPTPRGGGAAIVVVATLAFAMLLRLRLLDGRLCAALCGGGLIVAAVGFVDDRRPLSAHTRLIAHFGAALWALLWLGGLPPLRVGQYLIVFGYSGYVLGVVGITWTLNLFNFMDGIDGIAASEAIFVSLGAVLIAAVTGTSDGIAASATVFGATCCGFLLWNWPRAKIFMGDVGSGYLGFVIAVLAIAESRLNPLSMPVWFILGAAFFVDAPVTLVRRLLRGEPVQLAHRSHAYQHLARRWGSHLRVTVALWLINLFWLLPCGWLAMILPGQSVWIVLLALTPMIILALRGGAGRPEAAA